MLHVKCEWLTCPPCLCMCMCVRLFSELSHRSLRCLAGFYADGLINGWEMLVLHYGYSPSCNARHDPPPPTHTHRANRKRKKAPPTITLPCKWQLPKQVKVKGSKTSNYTQSVHCKRLYACSDGYFSIKTKKTMNKEELCRDSMAQTSLLKRINTLHLVCRAPLDMHSIA